MNNKKECNKCKFCIPIPEIPQKPINQLIFPDDFECVWHWLDCWPDKAGKCEDFKI